MRLLFDDALGRLRQGEGLARAKRTDDENGGQAMVQGGGDGDDGFALFGVESRIELQIPLARRRPRHAHVTPGLGKDEIQGVAAFGEARESADFVEGVMHLANRQPIELELDPSGKARIRLQSQLRHAAARKMEEDVVFALFLNQRLKDPRARRLLRGGGGGGDGTKQRRCHVGEEQPGGREGGRAGL